MLFVACLTVLAACTTQNDSSRQNTKGSNTGNLKKTEGIDADYISTDRVIWQKPEMVINMLGNLEDKTVADIGAGSGYFSKRLVEKKAKVIAIDIDERFIHYLDSIKVRDLPAELSGNLEPRLATPDDPNLKPNEVDAVLIVNTFMYMIDRVAYLKTLREGMLSGGRILIIDFKKQQTPVGPPLEIRIALEEVIQNLLDAGFKIKSSDSNKLKYQYFVLAEK